MAFELPELPFAPDALAPHISEETLSYHYGKHHRAYVDKLNALTQDSPLAEQTLEELIQTSEGPVFNNAAQVWNHTFYWQGLSPHGGGAPSGSLAAAIDQAFGSFAAFQEAFTQKALTQFGSGWAWLTKDPQGALALVSTSNAGNPLRDGHTPLLTCDVWEHAYYVDTRNNRGQYLKNFWALVHWDFVAQNFAAA